MPKWILGCLLVCGMACSATYADTIGPNCATCGGVVYTLTYTPEGAAMSGTQWFDFTVEINTTGINKTTYPNAQVLTAVALGVPTGSTNVKLVSAPSAGGWSFSTGGTNSGGCSGHGGFDCAQATLTSTGTGSALGVPTGPGDIYYFTFGFLLPAGTSGEIGSDIKAVYDATSGSFGGLQMSPGGVYASPGGQVPPVPEPASLALLASGLLVVGTLLKRR